MNKETTKSPEALGFWFMVFLSILAMLGYLASDMYLPAFPAIKKSFATTSAHVQLTLGVYMAGLAIGQLFYGVLSDHVGHRSVLIIGLVIFILATIACSFSRNIYELIAFRLVQSLGVCAATVIWQPIVVNRYSKETSQRVFAIVFSLLGVSPALAPVIGGILTTDIDWQSIFILLTCIGIAMLIATLCALSKVKKTENKKKTMTLSKVFHDYKTLMTSRFFLGHVGVICLTTAAYFAYITGSPFVFKEDFQYNSHIIGFLFIPQTIAFMLGGYASKFFLKVLKPFLTLQTAIVIAILAAVIQLCLSIRPFNSSLEFITPFLFIAFANGIIYPTVMAIILNHFKEIAGTTAGFSGFLFALLGSVGSAAVSAVSEMRGLGVAMVMLVMCVLSFPCYMLAGSERKNIQL